MYLKKIALLLDEHRSEEALKELLHFQYSINLKIQDKELFWELAIGLISSLFHEPLLKQKKISLDLMRFAMQKEEFQYAYKIYLMAYRYISPNEEAFLIWSIFQKNGRQKDVQYLENIYLEQLKKRKNFSEGHRFLHLILKSRALDEELLQYLIYFSLCQDNYSEIKKILNSKTNLHDLEDTKISKIIFSILVLDSETTWKKSQLLFEIFLYHQVEAIKHDTSNAASSFLRHLYDYFVYYPNESFGLTMMIKYLLIGRKTEFLNSILKYSKDQKQRSCTNFNHEQDNLMNLRAIAQLETQSYGDYAQSEESIDNGFDFATDLLNLNTLFNGDEAKLHRNEEFLKKIGHFEEAKKIRTMTDSNENNLSTRTIPQSTLNQLTGTFYDEAFVQKSVSRSLMKNHDDKELEMDFQEKIWSSYLRNYPLDLQTQFDCMVSFFMMGAWALCERVLSNIRNSAFLCELYPLDANLVLAYYEILIFMKRSESHKALKLVDETKRLFDGVNAKLLEFYYLEGEIYFELGLKEKSMNCFYIVERIYPGHRLTHYYLRELCEE